MKKFRGQQAWRRLAQQSGSRLGSCGGKQGYTAKDEARAVLERMRESPRYRPKPGHALSVYFCNGCNLFHVGNKPVPVPRVKAGRRKAS